MKRRLRAFWCLLVPVAIIGGIIYCTDNSFDNPIMPILIFLGICVVLNLPMCLAMIIDDACDNRLLTFFGAIIFSPIWLVWNWFITIKSLIKGRSGVDWMGNSGSGGKSGGGRTNDTRSSDNTLFGAMDRAISRVCSNTSNYPNGSYVRFAGKDVKFVVTKLFGIKIYGTVYYELTNYNMLQHQYEQDINDALEEAQRNLMREAEQAVDDVREKYKGFDNEWSLEVSIDGKVKG